MSSRLSSAKSNQPGCPHCRNLGLPHNHWLRESMDPNSPIVCKVLLSTECRYCHEFGHTIKRCPQLSQNGSSGFPLAVPIKRDAAKPKPVLGRGLGLAHRPTLTSSFSAFADSDSDSEDDEEDTICSSRSSTSSLSVSLSWKSISDESIELRSIPKTFIGKSWVDLTIEFEELYGPEEPFETLLAKQLIAKQ